MEFGECGPSESTGIRMNEGGVRTSIRWSGAHCRVHGSHSSRVDHKCQGLVRLESAVILRAQEKSHALQHYVPLVEAERYEPEFDVVKSDRRFDSADRAH